MISADLFSHLRNDPNIALLTESIYPQFIPLNRLNGGAAITFAMDGDEEETLLDGRPSSLRIARFSVDCWDRSYINVHSLSSVVHDALVGYMGPLGTLTDRKQVDQIRKEDEFETYESDSELHCVRQQFSVAYF